MPATATRTGWQTEIVNAIDYEDIFVIEDVTLSIPLTMYVLVVNNVPEFPVPGFPLVFTS
jgi:hypothetical protein